MLPSIFGESLFDDWMSFPFRSFASRSEALNPTWIASCMGNMQHM